MEEKMDEKKQVINKKNPLGAAVLSTLFPGVGFFYIGNFVKGIAYILVFVSLIVLATKARGHEIPVFVLMCVGFYIFQIFDSFDEAKKSGYVTKKEKEAEAQRISLFVAIVMVALGIILQLANLDIIRFRDITRLWPIVLIALGIKYIYSYSRDKEVNKGEENE
jgi:TM2 domain-containing membrane protein YozV